jgi:hypothetical protein
MMATRGRRLLAAAWVGVWKDAVDDTRVEADGARQEAEATDRPRT